MIDERAFRTLRRRDRAEAELREPESDPEGQTPAVQSAARSPGSLSVAFRAAPLLYVGGATLVLTIASLAQAVLMPLALATLLAFAVTPPVTRLERSGLHRVVSVVLVVLVVLGGVGSLSYGLFLQFNDLATRMPEYSASIKSKLAALRETHKGALTQIQETVTKAGRELDKQEMASHPPALEAPVPVRKDVQPVLVVPTKPSDAELLRATWAPFVRPIGTAGIVLVLMTFILVQRDDLRQRLIRLAGPGRVAAATAALDETAQRMSRFLYSQSLINAAFGSFIAAGLLVIGIPYALLWGVTAALLRFVPYLGTTIAMLLPASLAFVESDGWGRTFETLVLFWAAGLIAYILDPIVNGSRTGTSSFALLVSAIFWTWLWGPIGLLLSTPITICLVVLGKHVPEMRFLAVLCADEPSGAGAAVMTEARQPAVGQA